MTRLLAIEWDSREARLVVATALRGAARVEEMFAVPLLADGAEGELADAEVAHRIAAAVNERKLGGVETLVAVARASIELKVLALPPSPDDEVPELARFQALREFNNMGEDWPLDFIALSGGATEPRSILAAALSPAAIKEILAICEPSQLKPTHLVLRPCAAASLLRRTNAERTVRLLIDILVDEADLTVLVDESVVFMRTARLSHGLTEAEQAQALVAETRRTLAAVAVQLSGRRVEQVCVCGEAPSQKALARAIEEQLKLPAIVFDPLAGVEVSGEVAKRLPSDPGRFAPLIGMLLDEASGAPHTIDFLSPKKRPAPPSRKRIYALAGAAAAAVVLFGIYLIWNGLGNLDDEVAGLTNTVAANKQRLEAAKKNEAEWKEIEKWVAGDVVWLDEIANASVKIPPASDVIFTEVTITSDTRGPTIALGGIAKNVAAIDATENALRDETHRVESRGNSPDTSRPGYTRKFDTVVKKPVADERATTRGGRAATNRPSAIPRNGR